MDGKVNSKIIGAAGEHYVMSRLLRMGLVAALAPEGVPTVDILVTNPSCQKICSVQVKTRRDIGYDKGWSMDKKHENINDDELYYCFVDLGKKLSDPVKTYVIPSRVVANILKKSHSVYLSGSGLKGRERKDTDMRRLLVDYTRIFRGHKDESLYKAGWLDPYLENWDLIAKRT